MERHKIEAHKITKPIQLMAVWFIALLLVDSIFLAAAAKINEPAWISLALVVSAIMFVPLFLAGVFLMQTVFRKELQEDQGALTGSSRAGRGIGASHETD